MPSNFEWYFWIGLVCVIKFVCFFMGPYRRLLVASQSNYLGSGYVVILLCRTFDVGFAHHVGCLMLDARLVRFVGWWTCWTPLLWFMCAIYMNLCDIYVDPCDICEFQLYNHICDLIIMMQNKKTDQNFTHSSFATWKAGGKAGISWTMTALPRQSTKNPLPSTNKGSRQRNLYHLPTKVVGKEFLFWKN